MLTLVHPILAVVAVGGLIYAFSSMYPLASASTLWAYVVAGMVVSLFVPRLNYTR